jgi:hypothetical protein
VNSGLGTGISTSAFIKHGVSATIVEIDPAVYAAATEYFGLEVLEPEKVYIMDGRSFVVQTIANESTTDVDSRPELFDYVIHDLFSGGGVPGHLFTLRFWEDLTKIIKPDAVVAVVSRFLIFSSLAANDGDVTEFCRKACIRLGEGNLSHPEEGLPAMPYIPRFHRKALRGTTQNRLCQLGMIFFAILCVICIHVSLDLFVHSVTRAYGPEACSRSRLPSLLPPLESSSYNFGARDQWGPDYGRH